MNTALRLLCALPVLSIAQIVNAQASGEETIARGFRTIADQRLGNCMACHSMPDAQGKKSGIQSTFAPPLDNIASRYNLAALRQWVSDARLINPQTLMPPFAANGILTTSQIEEVLAALLTLK